MSKPTLVQKALNRPSQTYGNVDNRQRKDYYSTKQDMLRIAAAASSGGGGGGDTTNERNTTSATLARTLYYPSHRSHQQQQYHHEGEGEEEDDDDDGDDLEVFFTPNTSPRTSMASSVATITFPATRKPSRRSLTNVTSPDSHQPLQLPLSHSSSSAEHAALTLTSIPKTQTQTPMSGAVPSTRTPSTSSRSTRTRNAALSSSSSLSSTSLDGHSVFSDDYGVSGGESTVLSTPYQSDADHLTPKAKDKDKDRLSRRSTTTTTTPSAGATATATATGIANGNASGRSQPRDEDRRNAQSSVKIPAVGHSSTSSKADKQPASASASASPPGIGSNTTTTIVIGSSRDPKGKEREKERKSTQPNSNSHSNSATSTSASTSTPNPSTSTKTNSSSSTSTGTISISSRTKYVPPSSKTPHTFSAFAAIPVPTPGSGSSAGGSPPSPAPAHGQGSGSSTSTTAAAPATATTPAHSLSRKAHMQISSLANSNANTNGHAKSASSSSTASTAAAFSTTTPRTPPKAPTSASASTSVPKTATSKPSTSTSKTPSSNVNTNTNTNTNGYADPTPKTNTGQRSKPPSSSSSPHPSSSSSPSMTRSPGDTNGNAKPSPSSSSPSSSSSSPPSPPPPSSTQQQQQQQQQYRKPPPPVLAPLPIQIQKPGQSAMMTMFGMDALLEEEEEEEEGDGLGGEHDEDEEEGRSTPRMYSNSREWRHANGYGSLSSQSTSTHTRRAPPKTLSAEVTSLQQTFTTPGERPSKGTQGYTSLVLPRAPDTKMNGKMQVKANKDASSGRVDLTKSGVAQMTMASVEVVRGLGGRARGKGVFGIFKFGPFGGKMNKDRPKGPLPVHIPPSASAPAPASANGDAPTDGGGAGTTHVPNATANTTANMTMNHSVTPLGFTAYRAPPSYVPSGSVLVQVWAVGVDGVDGRLVGVRFGFGGASDGVGNYAGGNGGDETEEETETEEEGEGGGGNRTEGEGEGDETETETETETEREDVQRQSATDDEGDDEDGNELSTKSTPARPTQTSPGGKKGGGLAALGRSLSLRLTRGGGGGDANGNTGGRPNVQRSASAGGVLSSKTKTKTKAGVDANTNTNGNVNDAPVHKRTLSFSLKRSNTAASRVTNGTAGSSAHAKDDKKMKTQGKDKSQTPGNTRTKGKSKSKSKSKQPKQPQASVGYIPGRSFVGRVLECGWEVRDEIVRKGEWVVGLLDVRKGGALAEFIVVDRHRVHRVPQPQGGSASHPLWVASPTSATPSSPVPSQRSGANGNPQPQPPPTLTLEELALLPLCGLPAYRAVRTFMFAFSSIRDGPSAPSAADRRGLDFVGGNYTNHHQQQQQNRVLGKPSAANNMMADHDQGHRRRALVLRGHDGVGAMAVQMLVRRGWLVSVHVPCSALPYDATPEVVDHFMQLTEERARAWGADEIIHDDSPQGGVNGEWEGHGGDDGRGAAVRLMDMIREDGDVFDAVLDTVGGKEVREAGERLLRSVGSAGAVTRNGVLVNKRRGMGQFTTLVGDVPERVVPSAGDNFRAGLRSLRLGGTATTNAHDSDPVAGNKPGDEVNLNANDGKASSSGGKVGYAWVSVAQDVDWEGDDVGETLGTVVRMALEDGVRPVVEDMELARKGPAGVSRAVPFDYAPHVFVDNGPLRDGGTVVVKIAE